MISLFDRGYLFGDGVFETLRAYEGRVFRLGRHLDRLAEGARALDIALPMTVSQLAATVREASRRAAAADVYVRVTLSRGVGGAGIAYTGQEEATLSIVAYPSSKYPDSAYELGISSGLAETRKVPPECLPARVKTANYLPNVLARGELTRRKLLEGVQLSISGRVVSGTVSNVFHVVEERLVTPDEASGCRPGITREAIIEVARQLGISVEEAEVVPTDLTAADELFFANTMMECLPVARFEDTVFPAARPMTRAIHEALRRLIREEDEDS